MLQDAQNDKLGLFAVSQRMFFLPLEFILVTLEASLARPQW